MATRSPDPAYTWLFLVNQAVSGGGSDETMRAEMLLQIKDALIGGGSWTDNTGAAATAPSGWEVVRSCDGVTAPSGIADATDRWVDNADVIWETNGTAHSWIELSHPDYFGSSQPLNMLLDCSETSAGTRNGTLGIYLSQNSFTSSGTVTNRPTAVGEVEVLAADGTSSSGWQGLDNNSVTAKSFHLAMTDDATKFRIFITDGGNTEAFWDLFRVENAPLNWTRPALMSVMSADNAAENNTWTSSWNAPSNNGLYVGYDDVFGRFTCRTCMPCFTSSETAITTLGGNTFDSTIMPVPIILVADAVAVDGPITAVPDCWWVPSSNGTGTHAEDDQGNLRQFCQFGDMMVEWNRTNAVVG